MRPLTAFSLIAAALISPSLASPHERPRTFTLTTPPADGSNQPGGLMVLRNAQLRYAAFAPASAVLPRAPATVSSTVAANPDPYDTSYISNASIGSPPSTYKVILDTGSTDFRLNAPKLGASGSTISTTVTIGAVTVTRQSISLGDPSGQFQSSDPDGIVSLSPTSKTFYSNAVAQGVIAPILTANLKPSAPSTFGFGFIDSTAYKGSITYVDGDSSQGFWTVSCRGYTVGSAGTFVSSTISPLIIDTGTTLLLLPDAVVNAYYGKVTGASYDSSQGGYTFPCSAKLPDLILAIGPSYMATVPGAYFNYAPTGSGSKCFGGLQSSSGLGVSIAGLVFIKSQFVVFKGVGSSGTSVGFAKKA